MQPLDDSVLLRRYVENHSDEAFASLVERHINLVYSVALRQAGRPGDAEEITQAVFIILARKASSLRHDKALASWLFQTTRLTANNFVRSGIRRHHHEQEAYMQSLLNEPGDDTWQRVAPLLDAAVAKLGEKDRRAVVLRFYEGRNLREVGAVLGASEDAAEKRIARALEKLRKIFSKHGVNSTTTAIAGTLSANSVQVAPAGLAKTISAVALAKGAAASASTLTLVKGALKVMAWSHTKTAVVLGVVAILAATSTVVIRTKMAQQQHRLAGEPIWSLTPVSKDITCDIQPNGTINFQATVGATNSASVTVDADYISDASRILWARDDSGNSMKFVARAGGGYYILFNRPVPPGGTMSYTMEGEIAGAIKPDSSGECSIGFSSAQGNVAEMPCVEVWRLPPGATLLGNDPGMEASTNNSGQIELRSDKMVPARGLLKIGFAYQLASNAR